MKKIAFRIIPGRQPGLFRPQVGKRVFWLWWQWYDIKHPPDTEGISEAVISVWNLASNLDRVNAFRRKATFGDFNQ